MGWPGVDLKRLRSELLGPSMPMCNYGLTVSLSSQKILFHERGYRFSKKIIFFIDLGLTVYI